MLRRKLNILKYSADVVTVRMRNFLNLRIRKRLPFSHLEVVGYWGKDGAGLPYFSSRLFHEVTLLQNALSNHKFTRSLEIGCGYGRLTPWINQYSETHYAVEPEEKLLNDAISLNPKVHFFKAKAQKLPFPDEFFDLCITWTVLQHIPPREIEKAVDEIKRVAKKSATIVITEGVGSFYNEAAWFRTLDQWRELFEPWVLVWYADRTLEATANKNQGKVMRFEIE